MKKFSLFLSLLVTLSFAAVAKAQAPLSYRVDTIDALLNITTYGSDAKLIAYVGGGTARDDGLGGLFFFDGTSSAATNVYTIYRPKSIAAAAAGRWYKLPTQVANQQTDVTVTDEAGYAWKLLDSNAANAFSVGLTSANVYMQTWGSRPLYINSSLGGNNTILNLTGGNVGIGTSNPLVEFVISDSGAGGLEINPNASGAVQLEAYSRSGAAYVPMTVNGSVVAINATSTGNVGIGSSSFSCTRCQRWCACRRGL